MDAQRLRDLLECYDLEVRNSEPTHNLSGQLDVVVSRRDGSCPVVTTYDVDVSDHQLLSWSVDGSRAVAPATIVNFRPWRTVNVDELRAALTATPLCDADQWVGRSVDELVQLYDTVLTGLADTFAPTKRVSRRPRWPWFDSECRSAKRLARRLERAAAAAGRRHDNAAAAVDAWRTQRRIYRHLRRQKRDAFWQSTVKAERSNPKRLWQTIDTLLDRRRRVVHQLMTRFQPIASRNISRTRWHLYVHRPSLRPRQIFFEVLLV